MAERTLEDMRQALASETGLVTVATRRADGAPLLSVVNAGILDHPVTGRAVLGFVVRGSAAKRRHISARPEVSIVARRGWQWVGVEGTAVLIGPDDPLDGFEPAGLPKLLRDVFIAAGGTHDDWDEYDQTMAAERRTAVLVTPTRVFGPG